MSEVSLSNSDFLDDSSLEILEFSSLIWFSLRDSFAKLLNSFWSLCNSRFFSSNETLSFRSSSLIWLYAFRASSSFDWAFWYCKLYWVISSFWEVKTFTSSRISSLLAFWSARSRTSALRWLSCSWKLLILFSISERPSVAISSFEWIWSNWLTLFSISVFLVTNSAEPSSKSLETLSNWAFLFSRSEVSVLRCSILLISLSFRVLFLLISTSSLSKALRVWVNSSWLFSNWEFVDESFSLWSKNSLWVDLICFSVSSISFWLFSNWAEVSSRSICLFSSSAVSAVSRPISSKSDNCDSLYCLVSVVSWSWSLSNSDSSLLILLSLSSVRLSSDWVSERRWFLTTISSSISLSSACFNSNLEASVVNELISSRRLIWSSFKLLISKLRSSLSVFALDKLRLVSSRVFSDSSILDNRLSSLVWSWLILFSISESFVVFSSSLRFSSSRSASLPSRSAVSAVSRLISSNSVSCVALRSSISVSSLS